MPSGPETWLRLPLEGWAWLQRQPKTVTDAGNVRRLQG